MERKANCRWARFNSTICLLQKGMKIEMPFYCCCYRYFSQNKRTFVTDFPSFDLSARVQDRVPDISKIQRRRKEKKKKNNNRNRFMLSCSSQCDRWRPDHSDQTQWQNWIRNGVRKEFDGKQCHALQMLTDSSRSMADGCHEADEKRNFRLLSISKSIRTSSIFNTNTPISWSSYIE